MAGREVVEAGREELRRSGLRVLPCRGGGATRSAPCRRRSTRPHAFSTVGAIPNNPTGRRQSERKDRQPVEWAAVRRPVGPTLLEWLRQSRRAAFANARRRNSSHEERWRGVARPPSTSAPAGRVKSRLWSRRCGESRRPELGGLPERPALQRNASGDRTSEVSRRRPEVGYSLGAVPFGQPFQQAAVMSTSMDSRGAVGRRRYADFDEYVDYQLRKTRQSIRAQDVLTAALTVCTILLGYTLLFVVVDQWLVPGGLGFWPRLFLLAVVLTAAGWVLARGLVVPALKQVSELFAARQLEHQLPTLKSLLTTLVSLRRARRPVAPEVLRAIQKRAAVTLANVDVEQLLDRRPLLRAAVALLVVVTLFCLYVVVTPKKVPPSVWRAFFPAASVPVATRTEIYRVEPGDTEVLRGARVEVTVDVRGEPPEQVQLLFTTADRRFVDEVVPMEETQQGLKQYRTVLSGEEGRGLLQDVEYYVVAGDARSRTFHIRVVQPPTATVDQLRYSFPDYMKREDQTVEGGHVDTWEGTTVTVVARANMPVTSARLVFSESEDRNAVVDERTMEITDGTLLTAQWKALRRPDGSHPRYYHIEVENQRGDTDPDPTFYTISIRPDQPPEVRMVEPRADLELPSNAVLPLVVEAHDPDFAVRYLTLRLGKNGEPLNVVRPIFDGEKPSVRVEYELDLKRLLLKPGDLLSLWVEAQDNKRPLANRTNTPKRNVRITEPAAAEQVERLKDELRRAFQQRQPEGGGKTGAEAGPGGQSGQTESTQRPGQQAESTQSSTDESSQSEQSEQPSSAEPAATDQTGQAKEPGGRQSEQTEPAGEAGPGNETAEPPPLQNDGSDDDEVLRRLLEQLQAEQSAGEGQPGQTAAEQQPASDQTGAGREGDERPSRESTDERSSRQDSEPTEGQPEEGGTGKAPAAGPQQPGGRGGEATQERPPKGGQPRPDRSAEGGPRQPGPGVNEAQPSDEPASQPEQTDRSPVQPERPATGQPATGPGKEGQDVRPESGQATPDTSPDSKPTAPAGKQVEREPGTEPRLRPGQRRPGEPPPAVERRPGNLPRPPDGTLPGGSRPTTAPPTQQQPGSGQPGQSQPGGPGSSAPATTGNQPGASQPGQAGPTGQPATGQPAPGSGQGGEQAEGGAGQPGGKSGSSNAQPPAGTSQPQQPSAGQTPAGQRPSKPGGQPEQPGETGTQPKEGEPGAGGAAGQQPGQQGPSGPASGAGGGQQPGGGQKSQPATPGLGAGGAASNTGGGGLSADGSVGPATGPGGGTTTGSDQPEAPNLEFTKRAVNLVLRRLEKDLQRGKVDRKLLEELGWTEQDVRRFVERIREQLRASEHAQTPEELARKRQFEEMLRQLSLRTRGAQRRDAGVRKRQIENIQSRRAPVPPEYRELYEAFTRSLSRQTGNPSP